ncbi:hypothetical protein Ddye_014429 [Dipteronia dyeriana]|uniref:Transmembrane protein n=1 Tax=Dipteronia dyeriana TaxID=168575 RepID=A0AAD9X8C8_9ROSI|nr:hypothetical protein Ddye_014429 [Dipteronia dyeriana]
MAASNSTRSMLVTLLIFAMVFSPILPCQAIRFTPVHGINGVMRIMIPCLRCKCCEPGPPGHCCKCIC